MTGTTRHRHRPTRARSRFRRPLHVAAVTVGAAAVATWSLGPTFAAADSGSVEVVNTETVQVYADAEGAVDTERVYEQVELSGQGTVTLDNPIALEGLRNLDGFGGVETEDGSQVTTTTVDGVEQLRSVSEYDGELPLEVTATYELDGEPVEPGDVVGESGHLVVEFTVENVSAVPTEISYPDGRGGKVTETVGVPVPMVGSLTTITPPTFDEVTSSQANMAGDGKGGTKLSFTATLIPPIGDDTAVFGYEAEITDGVVPRADFTGLPVNPLKSPSFVKAAKSYQGGAQTGVALTEGAVEIDDNLLKLRDGAGDLLSGLIRLQAGSEELSAGLVDRAAPGAAELAAGLNDAAAPGAALLADGAGTLSDGLGDLDEGAGRLSDGLGTASAGGGDLATGAGRLDDGLGRLGEGTGDLDQGARALRDGQVALEGGLDTLAAGVAALPASVRENLQSDPSYQALLGSLQSISTGIGTRGDAPTAGTLLGGLNALQYGLANPGATPEACDAGDATRCGATDGLDRIATKLDGALAGPANAPGTVAALLAAIQSIKAQPGCDAACDGYVDAVSGQVGDGQRASLTQLRDGVRAISGGIEARILAPGAGLDRLRAGLSNGDPATCLAAKQNSDPSDDCGIKEGALFLQNAGIPMLVEGVTASIRTELQSGLGSARPGCDPEATLRCAAAALSGGGDSLVQGVEKLVAGVEELNTGGALLSTGAGDLADGLDLLDDGAGELAAGAGRAADGSQELTAGAVTLSAGISLAADGSQELSDGLGDAADGSVLLADGLGTAADGAPKLVDGAQRLSDEGTQVLIGKGEETATSYGQMYASLVAGAERADTEDMAYGAPEGAQGLTAYSFVLQGEDGAGARNLGRGLLAGGAAALAGGGLLVRRRFLA